LRRRSHGGETPYRVGAVTAKRPKRSGGAPKALDGDGAIGPEGGFGIEQAGTETAIVRFGS
jgi:hypothetical protein